MSQLSKVLDSPRLPTLPAAALNVIELVQRPDVQLDELGTAIGNDPALSTRILKTANSGFYGMGGKVTTLSRAVLVMGLKTVRTLALGFSLVQNLRKKDESAFDHSAYWQRCLYAAVSARTIAKEVKNCDGEEAFLGGLLHSLGVLAMNEVLGEEYAAVFSRCEGRYQDLAAYETEAFDASHAEIGGALAEKWNLSPQIVEVARHYNCPDEASEEHRTLVRVVHLSCLVADLFTSGFPGQALGEFVQRAEEWFQIQSDLLSEIHPSVDAMRPMFDLPESKVAPAELLSRAHEALSEISLQTTHEATVLLQEKERLAQDASTDPLTGIANRRQLDEFLAQQVEIARRYGHKLGVLFIDLDHFKRLNDTHGHQTGDNALVEVASVLRRSTRAADLVARYGGEEFAVVLPETGVPEILVAGERIRAAVEAIEVTTPSGATVKTSASIGGASVEVIENVTPESLMAAADAAVYEAKKAGRNQVRMSMGSKAA